MGDLLSQAEIDALLNSLSTNQEKTTPVDDSQEKGLTPQEIDVISEISNISMGTASTTLYTLLKQKVVISMPNVMVTSWESLLNEVDDSYVIIRSEFTSGLKGTNLILLKKEDVKTIAEIMMGEEENKKKLDLTDLHITAAEEAMNQMMGAIATALSSMFNKKIEISPTKLFKSSQDLTKIDFRPSDYVVNIVFEIEIGNLIKGEMKQVFSMPLAKEMINSLTLVEMEPSLSQSVEQSAATMQTVDTKYNLQQQTQYQQSFNPNYASRQQTHEQPQIHMSFNTHQKPVNVQPIQFQPFDEGKQPSQKENISLIMDVPLQITVELGRTKKLIREILEFAPGTIIELDKLAGEPVDVLVNGKIIAKGEVVIIDESFGIRIVDIVQPSKRL